MKYVIMLGFLIVSFGAYAQSQSAVKNDTLYKSVNLSKNDKTFLKLKAVAQSKIQQFIDAVKAHGMDYKNYHLIVKSDFVEGNEHEHMWSQIVQYKDKVFYGIFIDKPFTLKKLKTGQKLSVKQTNIEDWAIYDANDNKIAGGFSTEYLDSKEKE